MDVALVMFRPDGRRRSFPVSREQTTIGRRPDCDLRIPLTDVSRKHCRLKLDAAGLQVSDLGSSNGTWVNGRRVSEEDLDPGDTLRIGPVKFIVQIDGEPALDGPPPAGRAEDPLSDTADAAGEGGEGGAADESLALRPTAAAEVGDEGGSELRIDPPDEDADDDLDDILDLDGGKS